MKTVYLFIVMLLVIIAQSFSQTWQWTHPEPNGVTVNDSSYTDAHEDDAAHDIETDASGNIYVLGSFQDSLYLNNKLITRGHGSYLAKYDSTGKLLWNKLFVNAQDDNSDIRASDLTVNASGVYVTGKYVPGGVDYDCGGDSVRGVLLRSYNIGSFNFTSGGTDVGIFLTKFNSNGTVVWNKTATDPVLCKDGGRVWTSLVQSNPIITSDNANNIVCGFVCESNKTFILIDSDTVHLRFSDGPAPQYLIVAKYNSAGTLQWLNNAGGQFNESADVYNGTIPDCNSLISDKNNNIFFLGIATDSTFFGSQLFRITTQYFANAPVTFISKISSAGVWQYVKELSNTYDAYMQDQGGSVYSNPEKLAVDNGNNIYALVQASTETQVILGDTVSHGIINTSCYLVKMNNSGNFTWARSFGNTGGQTYSNSIHFNNNSLYICGLNPNSYLNNYQRLVFSGLYVTPATKSLTTYADEYFISKADLNGNFIWETSFGSDVGSANGLCVKAFNGNIYTCGNYLNSITSLGHLNGNFTNPQLPNTSNIFFGKLKDQYIKVGAVAPTSLIPGCTVTIPFTSTGLTFSGSNTFTAELSDQFGDFTNTTAIGSTVSTGTGSITATIPASLNYSSGYRVRIHSSDTLKTGYGYYAYADTPYALSLTCPVPSAGFTVTNITATTATLNWTAVPCASGYKVQYRVKGTTSWTTVNITKNTSTLNVTSLTANTIYQWRVATKCKNNGTNSFSAFSATKQFTTTATFAVGNDNISEVSDLDKLNVFIQPNPATTNAVLIINGKLKNATITITDFVGKTIWKQDVVNGNRISLPAQNLAGGIYLVKLVNGNETRMAKLVKE